MATVFRRAISAVAFALWAAGAAVAQSVGGGQAMNNEGECNGNIQGSGNTIIINCYPTGQQGTAPPSSDVLVVLTADNMPTVQTWQADMFGNITPFNFFPGVVNYYNSTFTLQIGEERASYSIAQNFPGRSFRMEAGDHPYSMQMSLVYANGAAVNAQCNGIVDLRSSATLVPRMNIQVDPNFGQIAPLDCNFIARAN